MSRHKVVQNLDDDDLYDEDEYGEEYDQGMTAEDEEQFMDAIAAVKQVSSQFPDISEKEIKDAVWDSYFNVDDAVNVLLDEQAKKETKKKKQAAKKPKDTQGLRYGQGQWQQQSRNSSWKSGGYLLGGSSSSNKPTSKLAALAKARAAAKRKTQEESPSTSTSESLSSPSQRPLDRLTGRANNDEQYHPRKLVSALRRTGGKSKTITKPLQEDAEGSTIQVTDMKDSTSQIMEKLRTHFDDLDQPKDSTRPFLKPASTFSIVFTSNNNYFGNLAPPREILSNDGMFFFPVSKQQTQEIRKGFQGPSPDEKVKQAQSKAKGFDPKLEKTRAEMEKVKIGPPAPKVKLIDVVSEYKKQETKPNISFVVIGHVDAGKSTLMGRLLYDVGAVDRRTIEKYKRESEKVGKSSFALAWVLDETEEERTRGVTVDFATSYFETKAARFTVLDAPGHRDFVPNMIAGAAQADLAILVIDSSTDAFESGFNLDGQTKEHAVLVRSLGVQNIIVAVNKLDNCDWSQDRFDEISQQLSGFLTSAGFAQDKVTFVPCSGLLGDYVVKPGNVGWYHGKTLLESLESIKPTIRDIQGPVRMQISDVFKNNHSGAVMVSGRLVSGTVQVGQQILIVPSDGATFTIRNVLVREEPRQWAVAGSNITLDIGTGADVNTLKPGDVVCSPDKPIPVTNKFKARILTFNLQRPIIVGTSIELHSGRANRAAKISGIESLIEGGKPVTSKNKRPPRHIGSGKGAIVEIEILRHSIPLETYSENKDLGRIVLRANGSTIAAGIVESLSKATQSAD